MTGDELRALQKPIKERYQADPATALVTMRATGEVQVNQLTCQLPTPTGQVAAGLHPAAGGSGEAACSGDMLLQSLVACAGVTLSAVATAMSITIRRATITAEGDADFRGTLGVSREVPIGLTAVRVTFDIDSDAPAEQLQKLIQLTERYCVIFQTLKSAPTLTTSLKIAGN